MAARRAGRPLRIEVIGSGDELVRGRSRDTNFPDIASLLTGLGHEVLGNRVVPDDGAAFARALRAAAARADAVITTGGLGPTEDDRTRHAAAAALRAPLVEHGPSARRLRAIWRRRGLPMPRSNLLQALLPRGARAIPNRFGSAPGFRFALGRAEVFCLPGPPREMDPMLRAAVLPALRRLAGGTPRAASLFVSCFGLPESVLAERIADLMRRGRAVRVGTAVGEGVITISIHGTGDAADEVPAVQREVLRRLRPDAYAAGRVAPGEHLGRLLLDRGLRVAFAESCTAGLAAARLADLPGVSAALVGGVVAYEDAAKTRLLGVPASRIRRQGAVSAEVAEAMARGARRRLGADLAVAITGVAGPGGGSAEKPVGLVWFAVDGPGGTRTLRRRFPGDRSFVRGTAANAALDLLRRTIEGVPWVTEGPALPGLDSNQE